MPYIKQPSIDGFAVLVHSPPIGATPEYVPEKPTRPYLAQETDYFMYAVFATVRYE